MTEHPISIEMLEEGHLLLLGTTGAGKTYQQRGFLERLRRADRRVGAVDKLGNHWGLTLSADGKRPGLDFIIFGGKRAHVPMTPDHGEQLGRLFVERNIPAIFDVSQWKSDEQQQRMADFADAVFLHNDGALHLGLDEAQSWVPQGGGGDAFRSVLRLAEQGRGNGIRLMMAAQRLSRIDKSASGQAAIVVAMRQTGTADRKAMRDLLAANAEDMARIESELPGLPTGTGFVWDPLQASLERCAFPANSTFDSSRTPRHGDAAPATVAVSGALVEELRAALAPPAEPESQKARKPESGRSAEGELIAGYERDLQAAHARIEELERENEELDAECDRWVAGIGAIDELVRQVQQGTSAAQLAAAPAASAPKRTKMHQHDADLDPALAPQPATVGPAVVGNPAEPRKVSPPAPAAAPKRNVAIGDFPPMTWRLIETLERFYPRSLPIEHLATIAKVGIKSSQWRDHFRAFEGSGLVEQLASNDQWRISQDGAVQLGLEPQPAAGEALVAFWRKAFQPAIGRMLQVLADDGGWLSRDEIGERAGVSLTSSTLGAGLKELRDHGVAVMHVDGAHRIADALRRDE